MKRSKKQSRVDFYDPLYEYVTFEEARLGQSRYRFIEHNDGSVENKDAGNPTYNDLGVSGNRIGSIRANKLILPFFSSIEVSRQSFLRQSNLAFLVFPSATHTRLAHSIGSCYLRLCAAKQVRVAIRAKVKRRSGARSIGGTETLSQFLSRNRSG